MNLHNIHSLGDLRVNGAWRSMASFCRSSRPSRHGLDLGLVWLLEIIRHLASPTENLELQRSNGWSWQDGERRIWHWQIQNHIWRRLLSVRRIDFQKLNRRWCVNFAPGAWIRLWKKLWVSSFYRDKISLWRLLNHGFFHHRRAFI